MDVGQIGGSMNGKKDINCESRPNVAVTPRYSTSRRVIELK